MLQTASRICLALAVLGLAGCQTNAKVARPSPEYAPVNPVPQGSMDVVTGSIFSPERDESWFGEKRAYRIGDIVTIVLSESTQASRSANTTATRETTNDALTPLQIQRLGGNGTFPLSTDSTLGSTIESTGSGTTAQTAGLTGSITASVVDVLANGNLVVRGEKLLTLSEGTEVIQVKGIIRPDDIQPDNSVLSRRLANAQITYKGTGELANAQKVPWGTNLFFSLWPF